MRSEYSATSRLERHRLLIANWLHAIGLRPRCEGKCLALPVKPALAALIVSLTATMAFAITTGSISGTVQDAQGAMVPGATVTLQNTETGVVQTIESDSVGFYRFSALPLGTYSVTFEKTGFEKYVQTNVVIDVDTAARVDAALKVGSTKEKVEVSTTQAVVDTENAQVGEVIGGEEMVDLPLNGRAYTDLLALQPGVVPFQTALFGSEAPANSLDNGLVSMAGAQDTHSGYMVNGANAVEGYSGGTFLVPTLDSIAEFRIITGDANAEYGNYSGGLVNVVTKSGTNEFHGDVFEFLRNSDFDSRNYFSPTRGVFHQNQFGGTIGGPIWRKKLFFFGDWQDTRQIIGQDTGEILVPPASDRTGNLSPASAAKLTGVVSGPYFASVLSTRLGYAVTNGEAYYTSACGSTSACVFPGGVIPTAAWSPVSPNVVPLIPGQTTAPNGTSPGYFSTSANAETLNDNKGAVRIDWDSKYGAVSFYYHLDPWNNALPYAGGSLPGFPGVTTGKAQLYVLSLTSRFGSTAVNVLNGSWTINNNVSGNTTAGAGTTPSSLGFASPGDLGIYTEAPQYENIPDFGFNNYSVGPANSIVSQFDNMYEVQDDFSKVIKSHTFKIGAAFHTDKVDIAHPNNASNGAFGFNGEETGYDWADMLLGAPSYYYQGAPAQLNLRDYYLGVYGQDTWRVNANLTLNLGVRWDVDPYWEDAHNASPVILPGIQSTQYPTAPAGWAFPGDDGIARRSGALTRFNNFGPRLGIAYTPHFSDGIMHKVFGDAGKSSIRSGYGMYYTNVQGANTFNFAAPPTHLFFYNTLPVMLAQPFLNRDSGVSLGQRFPIPVVAPTAVNWANYEPISSESNPLRTSLTPYEEHVDLSIERALSSNMILNIAYVGTFGHHLIVAGDNNPGNPALCLSVSQISEVTNGVTCGPNGENGVYNPVTGGVINGTRSPYGFLFGDNGYQLDIGNSSYNALEATLRRTGTRLTMLLSYTRSHAIDNGSGWGDQVFVYGNHNQFRALSNYDIPNNFAANYTFEMPWDLLFRKNNDFTRGWKLSGLIQLASGVPIEIQETDDNSLTGNSGLIFYGSTDEPVLNYSSGQSFYGDKNPRDEKPYFNTSLFSEEPLGGQGNAPRRMLHGPGEDNWNMALLKDVKIREHMNLEIRAEFFNLFNHAQFYGSGVVGGYINFGGFGLVTSAQAARIGQMAAKFTF